MEISSSDALPHFEAISDDIGIAIDAALRHLPLARHVALRRLCDGASAALLLRGDGRNPRLEPGCQQRMWRGRTRSPLPTLLLPSVDDDSAREFEEPARLPAAGSCALAGPEFQNMDLPGAEHTKSDVGDERGGVAVTLDFRISPPGGKAVAPTLPAVHFTEDRI